jgi:hypothetical protein
MRSVCVSLILSLMSAGLAATPGFAQADPWLIVSEPGEWGRREAITWQAGQRLRIRGQAFHPAGIVSVSVDGGAADLERDAANGIVTFTYFLLVDESAREVRIVARTARDSIPAQTFSINVRGAIPAPSPMAGPVVEPPPPVRAVPGFVPSTLIPGSGQLRTGRAGVGILVLGASAGVAAAGILSTEEEIACATRTTTCAAEDVLSRTTSRPYLIPGIVGAVAISAIGAWEARKTARAGFDAGGDARLPVGWLGFLPQIVHGRARALELHWQLARF